MYGVVSYTVSDWSCPYENGTKYAYTFVEASIPFSITADDMDASEVFLYI